MRKPYALREISHDRERHPAFDTQIVLIVAAVYLVLWVLSAIGIALPEKVISLLWVVVALIVILLLFRMVAPMVGLRLGELTMIMLA